LAALEAGLAMLAAFSEREDACRALRATGFGAAVLNLTDAKPSEPAVALAARVLENLRLVRAPGGGDERGDDDGGGDADGGVWGEGGNFSLHARTARGGSVRSEGLPGSPVGSRANTQASARVASPSRAPAPALRPRELAPDEHARVPSRGAPAPAPALARGLAAIHQPSQGALESLALKHLARSWRALAAALAALAAERPAVPAAQFYALCGKFAGPPCPAPPRPAKPRPAARAH
jgi:hypothetical protein